MKYKILLLILFFHCIISCSFGCQRSHNVTPTPLETIYVKKVPLVVEVAGTPEKRRIGLMYRKEMPENRGMIFVFQEDDYRSFWMKNTRIPLSVAFISGNGIIRDIQSMEPFDERPHRSSAKVRYALEVNQDWFTQNGIKEGDKIDLPDTIKSLK